MIDKGFQLSKLKFIYIFLDNMLFSRNFFSTFRCLEALNEVWTKWKTCWLLENMDMTVITDPMWSPARPCATSQPLLPTIPTKSWTNWPGHWYLKVSCDYTVCKFQDFSIAQIFHEINFGDSRSAKSAILTHLEDMNLKFYEFLNFFKTEITQMNKIQGP